jgi:VWFA-related protein
MSPSIPSPARTLFPTLAVVLAVLLLVAGVTAQEEPDEIYFDRVEVDIVNLEVFATDAAGRPIVGLTRDDFELLVDGVPTEIQNFYAASAAGAAQRVERPQEPELTEEPVWTPPPEQVSTVVIVVDNRHAIPGERKRLLEELADRFEAGLAPGTRAMVASLDGQIEVRQPLTTDGTLIAATLRELLRSSARGYGEDFELRSIMRMIEEQPGTPGTASTGRTPSTADSPSGDIGDVLFAIRSYQGKERAEVQASLDQMGHLLGGLGGMAGHKAVLYLGRGLNSAPGRALLTAFRDKFGANLIDAANDLELAAASSDTVPMFNRLAELANANRVSFYAVTTAGVGTSTSISGETGVVGAGGRAWSSGVDSVYRADQSTGLAVLATATGGRALAGSADYDLVADWISADAQNLYSLGFAAPEGPTGRSHRIEVRVPGRSDIELRHRSRLVTASREQRAIDRTLAMLYYGDGSNPMAITAEMGQPQPGERGTVTQPLLVKIPFFGITLLPTGTSHDGELTIHIVAEDSQGRVSDVSTLEAPVRVPAEQLEAALGGVAGYRLAMGVRPGKHVFVIGVRDVLGDVVSTLVVEHDVRNPAGDRRGRRVR